MFSFIMIEYISCPYDNKIKLIYNIKSILNIYNIKNIICLLFWDCKGFNDSEKF